MWYNLPFAGEAESVWHAEKFRAKPPRERKRTQPPPTVQKAQYVAVRRASNSDSRAKSVSHG
eukprot:1187792-Prorocentrum_minimum.AAC.3